MIRDERRLYPQVQSVAEAAEQLYLPELVPVIEPARGLPLVSRPWLDWARRVTGFIQALSGAAASGALAGVFPYQFSASTTWPTGTRQVRFDSGHPYTSVTRVFASYTSANNNDVKNLLLRIPVGSRLFVQEDDDHARFGDFTLSSAPIDRGTYADLPVTVADGTGGAIKDNAAVSMAVITPGGGGSGDVTGPSTATNEAIAIYNGTTGKIIKDSLKTIANVISDAVSAAVAAILPGGTLPVANLPAHHARHELGGSDAIKLDDLAVPDDTVDLDVSTGRHGLTPKLTNNPLHYLNGQGAWATVSGSGLGDVTGPASAVDSTVALFSGTTGKIVRHSAYGILQGSTLGYAGIAFQVTNATAGTRNWDIVTVPPTLSVRAMNDANGAAVATPLTLSRNGDVAVGGRLTSLSKTLISNTGGVDVASRLQLDDVSVASGSRAFQIANYATGLYFWATTDDGSAAVSAPLALDRTGNAKVGAAVFERGRTVAMGDWIDVAFSAANFTVSDAARGASFVVASNQVYVNHYTRVGKTVQWQVHVYGTFTTGSAPVPYILFKVPIDFVKSREVAAVYFAPGGSSIAGCSAYLDGAGAGRGLYLLPHIALTNSLHHFGVSITYEGV